MSDNGAMPKVREAIKIVEADGWYFVHQRGSHRHFKHPTKRGKVTIPGHPSNDLRVKTWKSILEQAGIQKGDLR